MFFLEFSILEDRALAVRDDLQNGGHNFTKTLDQILEKKVTDNEIVGAIFLVLHGNTLIYQKSLGSQNLEAQIPMALDSTFRLSSLSKLITSLAAGVLISQGELSYTDPVLKYLPYFTPQNPEGTQTPILIRHLLNHTAGLSYKFNEPVGGEYFQAGIEDGVEKSQVTLTQNLENLATLKLFSRPGTQWNYSLATDVLGAVIAEVTQKSLPEAIELLLGKPLGLTQTRFYPPDPQTLAIPYRLTKTGPRPLNDPEDYYYNKNYLLSFSPSRAYDPHAWPSGGVGMLGNGPDFVKILRLVLQNGQNLIQPQVMDLLTHNQIGTLATDSPGIKFSAATGIISEPKLTRFPMVSPGTLFWGGIYGHAFTIDLERNIACVLLTNMTLTGLSGDTFPSLLREIYAAPNL
ncbi:MAG: beta-lactamase family protein [Deltaproteobacteria bacterium]|nr:beta-lactamase family protein [Deltaproteobacteria bacterium]